MTPGRRFLSIQAQNQDEGQEEQNEMPRRRSPRRAVKGSKVEEEEAPKKKARGRPKKLIQDFPEPEEEEEEEQDDNKASSKKKRKGRPKKAVEDALEDDNGSSTKKTKVARKTTKKSKGGDEETETPRKQKDTKKRMTASSNSSDEEPQKASKTKRSKAADHQRLTERDELIKLWNPEQHKDSYTFKICSWNVAGLRALLRNSPERLPDLVTKNDIDVLCLQETKIQDSHLDDPKLKIRETLEKEGYESFYSCSTAKKGYAGTAVYIKRRGVKGKSLGKGKTEAKQMTLDGFFIKTSPKKQLVQSEQASTEDLPVDVRKLLPMSVSYKMGVDSHDAEGRLITVDFPQFCMTNVYVPNSGQKLERLSYRTEKWDKDFLAFLQEREKVRGVPIIWLGDLNIAHTNLEVWNDGAKHLPKQAGVTQQERDSFQAQLDSGYIDAFRKLHPKAKGCYTYWSQRAGNREPNKGLRLDYFICSPSLFDETKDVVVRDSYMLYDVMGSDHCPVILELEIKK